MKKVTFAINYRKPKADYKSNDTVEICIRYEYFCTKTNKKKIKNQSCGVRCKLSDWNKDWHKSPERLPILNTDPEYIDKNRKLFNLRKKLFVRDFSMETQISEKKRAPK